MPRPLDQTIDGTMSFGDHLEELRKRVLLALAPVLPLSIIAYAISNTIIAALLLPLFRVLRAAGLPPVVQNLNPPEAVLTQLKLSIVAAVVISAPWILWQIWLFVRPGLYEHERRFVNFLFPGSAILTAAGVALMYFVLLPLMLQVLVAIGTSIGVHVPQPPMDPRVQQALQQNPSVPVLARKPETPVAGQVWLLWPDMKMYAAVEKPGSPGSIEVVDVPRTVGEVVQDYRLSDYVNFVMLLFLGIVLAFQLPLIITLLGWLGMASPQWLRSQRRYAVFACAVLSVIITPGDVVSMLIMMLPLYALYELGILLLVLAPAHAVAQGSVFSLRRFRTKPSPEPADKPAPQPEQPRKSAQTDAPVIRRSRPHQLSSQDADGGEDSS